MCDSLVARGPRTIDGSTLFAKNSDRQGREPQPFVQLPAAYHSRGSRVRCTHVEIDQVAETYRVMGHSPDWCWGFEQGVNEYGVAIGNHATWSRDPLEVEPGLIGMDLVRLGLERGRDAREALEVIAALVETHGQGGSAFAQSGDAGYQNSFVIADGGSAWVLETTARCWAARAVEGASLTNALTLGSDWQIGSRDLERRALQQGFWSSDGRLDFKTAYGREEWPSFLTEARQGAAADRLSDAPLCVDTMKEWLRDHAGSSLPPTDAIERDDPARYSVCMHADPLSTTTASLVASLPADPALFPWPVWISFGTPCTGIFLPVYLEGVLPAPLASAKSSNGGRGAEVPSLWQTMRALQEKAAIDFERTLPKLQSAWRALEREIEADRERAEADAIALYADERIEAGEHELSAFMARSTQRVFDTAAQLFETI